MNPAKKDPDRVSMILKRRIFPSGIVANQAIVQTHGPQLRFILKSLLVVIFSASNGQPNCSWHADQTSDTLRKYSEGGGQSKNSRCKTSQLLKQQSPDTAKQSAML